MLAISNWSEREGVGKFKIEQREADTLSNVLVVIIIQQQILSKICIFQIVFWQHQFDYWWVGFDHFKTDGREKLSVQNISWSFLKFNEDWKFT